MRDRTARRDREPERRDSVQSQTEPVDETPSAFRRAWLSALGNRRVQRLMTQDGVDRQATELARETAARPAMTPERAIEHMYILRGDLKHTIGELSVWVGEVLSERRKRYPPGIRFIVPPETEDEPEPEKSAYWKFTYWWTGAGGVEGVADISRTEPRSPTDTSEWMLIEAAREADQSLAFPLLLLEGTPTEREITGAADELGKVAQTLAGLGYRLKEGDPGNDELGAAFIHNAENFYDFRHQVREMASPDEGSKES